MMAVPASDLLSESFSAMGNVVAEGVWNQLGRPELDRLALLVRESVQNSWDARTGASIRFSLNGFSLNPAQRTAYGKFFEKQPPSSAYVSKTKIDEEIVSIAEWLREPSPRILIVSDRGTSGLDGPTRADDAGEGERNFVDFLRNIGQPPNRAQTGGTFGYGKAALYLASRARTVVVYTRCMHGRKRESRLTAAALTHNFTHSRRRYTGRHWWGRGQRDEVLEPYLDSQADEIAASLGLPHFAGDECGTSIAMVAPVFDDGELKGIGMTCLRHLWPKLKAPNNARPPISLSVSVSGVSVPIPDPTKVFPYDSYWRAYCALISDDRQDITHRNEVVGHLKLERSLRLGSAERGSIAPDHELHPQHVALLRTPELVVKYLDAGRGLGNEHVGFTGVFRTVPDFDDAFARSEPPTHDDWQASSVADIRARSVVKVALQKIREQCREFATLHSPRVHGAEGSPLARLATEFALLAPGIGPSGSNEPVGAVGGEGGKRKRAARPQMRMGASDGNTIEEIDGRAYAVFAIDVTHAEGSDATSLAADVYPMLSGGARELEPPTGRSVCEVGWWESPRGTRVEGNPIKVGPRLQGIWKLFVPIVDSIAVAVEFDAVAETNE